MDDHRYGGREGEAAALARLYDFDMASESGDVDLYLALAARAGGPILELGVGSGRLAVPLASAGWPVTGVDRDPAMLERARQWARAAGADVEARLELVEADVTGLRLVSAGSFRLAFVAFNSLLLLPGRELQREAMRTLAHHLAPGGIAVVDVWQPDAEDLARYDGRLMLEYPREDPETGNVVTKIVSAVHDAATRSVTLTTIYEEGAQGAPPARWLRVDRLRLVSADELRGFAEDTGLEVEVLAGGYGLEPLAPGDDRAVLVAVRP